METQYRLAAKKKILTQYLQTNTVFDNDGKIHGQSVQTIVPRNINNIFSQYLS